MTTQDKTIALVTGANQGIGLAICKRLAAEHGYYVVMTARREDEVKAKAQELQNEGLEVEAHAMDVTSDESIDEVVRHVKRYENLWLRSWKADRLLLVLANSGTSMF